MALVQSDWAKGTKPMPTPVGHEVITVPLTLAVASTQVASGDIYEMGYLPENCALVDCVYSSTDLDTDGTPAVVLAFGVVNTGGTDLGTSLEAGLTLAQAGGTARMTPTATTLGVVNDGSTRKKLGFKVTTAADVGAAGTVKAYVSYRATQFGL